ncbi:MAG: alpha/beta hydrolase [Paracoccaceae bacterium]
MSARRIRTAWAAALLATTGALLAACAAATPPVVEIERENPPRGKFVQVEGLRVHYVAMGPEDGPGAVLIHGATGNLNDMTFDLAPRLAERGMRVIAFDRPGLGYTERPASEGWKPAVQARILRAAAERLGLERPVVAGHSWGAAVALAWAAAAPEATAGAVVISGATMPWREGGDTTFTPIVTSRPAAALGSALLQAFTLRDGGRGAAERIFRPQSPPEGYLDHLQAELILRTESFRANTEDIQKLNGALTEQAKAYPTLDVPVRILHGRADETTPPAVHAVRLAEMLPRAELSLFEGVGHMLHHARPKAVSDAVEALAASTAEEQG